MCKYLMTDKAQVDSVPTINAEPVVHGHWITIEKSLELYVCSKCGHSIIRIESNYCPCCGAKMDEGGEKDDGVSQIGNSDKLKGGIKVGDYITFGHYTQTKSGNDNTPIEWLVLEYDAKNNKALLISRYGLDCQKYNTKWADVTWETCSLRTWLNDTFLNKAFSKAEQGAILTTDVDNSSSQCYSGYSTSGGNNTQDKVFLLSYAEAKKYFKVTWEDSENTKSRVVSTAYAIAQGAYTSSSNKTADGSASGYWWLRSPGISRTRATYVYSYGSLDYDYVFGSYLSVRPALWLDLTCMKDGDKDGND